MSPINARSLANFRTQLFAIALRRGAAVISVCLLWGICLLGPQSRSFLDLLTFGPAVAETSSAPTSAAASPSDDDEVLPETPLLAKPLAAAGIPIGAFLLWWGRRRNNAAGASRSWPVAPAEVVESSVATYAGVNQRPDDPNLFVPCIRYRYVVHGLAYEGTRIAFGDTSTSDEEEARSLTAHHAAGAVITIRYDPANPSSSTIETDVPSSSMMIAGGVVLAASAMFLIMNAVSFGAAVR